jgi:ankyrin repeat protein
MFQEILQLGAKFDTQDLHGMQPLHIAAEGGNTIEMLELLKGEVAVDIRDNANQQPIHFAATSSMSAVVLLIDHGDIHANWISFINLLASLHMAAKWIGCSPFAAVALTCAPSVVGNLVFLLLYPVSK